MSADQENSPLRRKSDRRRKNLKSDSYLDNESRKRSSSNYFGPQLVNRLRGPRGPVGLPGPACNLSEIETHILEKIRLRKNGNIQYQASPSPNLVKLRSQEPITVEKRQITVLWFTTNMLDGQKK